MLMIIPAIFGFILLKIAFEDSPAEFAAKKLVVTVERTTMIIPCTPRPEISIALEMLVVPSPTIPIPLKYIHRLASVYAMADNAVSLTGFLTSLV